MCGCRSAAPTFFYASISEKYPITCFSKSFFLPLRVKDVLLTN